MDRKEFLISLFSVLLVINLVLIFNTVSVFIISRDNPDIIFNNIFLKKSNQFQSDPIIVSISEKCSYVDNKPKCVFDEIPMNYDYDRSLAPKILSPKQYFEKGGVCRDYAVLRHSALASLGIHCLFDFSVKNHVFLTCFHNDKVYVLDNDYYAEDEQ